MTQLLPRPKALKHLREAVAQRPVTLLCGGAGIGKSCLLEELFTLDGAVAEDSCVFIRFTKHDASLKGFLRRLALVLNLQAKPSLETPELMAAAIDALPASLIIVVDDFHDLGLNPAFGSYLAHLIELTTRRHDRPPRRWVVALRRLDEMPLGIWLAQERSTILSATDLLRLDVEERAELYRLRQTTTQAAIVGSMRTVMLRLGQILSQEHNLIAHRNETPLANTHGHRHRTGHEAVEALIQRLSLGLQYFLYATCLLDEIDLLDFLETSDLIPEALTGLGRIGLIHYDAVLQGLRYDDTVSDYLKDTLQYCPISVIEQATKHAAQAGVLRADVGHGFTILKQHAAWPSILALLGEHGLRLMDHEPVHGCIAAILAALPEDIITKEPVAAGLYGALTARVGFGDVSESWFQNCLANPLLQTDFKRQMTYRYGLEVTRRERSDAIDILRPLYEELESNPNLDTDLRALVLGAMAVISVQKKSMEEASHLMMLSLEAANAAYHDATHARVYHGAAYIRLRLGMPEIAITMADKAIEFADRDGFYGLAAWCVSIRQELALNIEHNPRLALTYLYQLELYAWLSEDARMMLFVAMVCYWIGVELADHELMVRTQSQIDRYEAVDDFMQSQLRLTLVPGSAYIRAWTGRFDEAALLVARYAPLSRPGHHQAYRWSELSIFYAASYSRNNDRLTRDKAYLALREARKQLQSLERGIEHENDVFLRLGVATIILGKYTTSEKIIEIIHNSHLSDARCSSIVETLRAMIEYWKFDVGHKRLVRSLKSLHDSQLGGISNIIMALPVPWRIRNEVYIEEEIELPIF